MRFARALDANISRENFEPGVGGSGASKGRKKGTKGWPRGEALVEGLEMPLSASVSSRGLLLCLYGRAHLNGRFACLWKSVQKYILNGCCIRDERHFWCFPQVSSRDLSRPGNGIPLVSIVSIFILHRERLHRYIEKNFAFWQNFVTRYAVTLRFDRSSSLENPLLPRLKFLLFVIPSCISKYIVFRDERISNCQSNMSVTITPPPSFPPPLRFASAFYFA